MWGAAFSPESGAHTHLPLGQADELLGGWSPKLEGVLPDPVTCAVFPWGRQIAHDSASFPGPPSGPWGDRVDKTQFLPWGCFQDSGHSCDPCSLCPVREGFVFCGRRRGGPQLVFPPSSAMGHLWRPCLHTSPLPFKVSTHHCHVVQASHFPI